MYYFRYFLKDFNKISQLRDFSDDDEVFYYWASRILRQAFWIFRQRERQDLVEKEAGEWVRREQNISSFVSDGAEEGENFIDSIGCTDPSFRQIEDQIDWEIDTNLAELKDGEKELLELLKQGYLLREIDEMVNLSTVAKNVLPSIAKKLGKVMNRKRKRQVPTKEELAARNKKILHLRKTTKMAPKEIAEQVGCSPNCVYWVLKKTTPQRDVVKNPVAKPVF